MRSAFRASLWVCIALLISLTACGSANTSSPELATSAFFQALRDGDDANLEKLISSELADFSKMMCGEMAFSRCFDIYETIPEGFEFTGEPMVSMQGADRDGTYTQLEVDIFSPSTNTTEQRCLGFVLLQEEERWLIRDLQSGGFGLCAKDVTATALAEQAARTATAIARQATAEVAYAHATATAVQQAADATATQLAQPTPIPEAFLTARQSFLAADLREVARRWSDDAVLVNAGFTLNEYGIVEPDQVALDGTSRIWEFRFASVSLQKTIIYTVQDGFLTADSGNSATDYKSLFAGKGEPFDIRIETGLDSDQVATIARESDAATDNPERFRMYLATSFDQESGEVAPVYWDVAIRTLFGNSHINIDGSSGEIIRNDFGLTGSPGAIPTPMAPYDSADASDTAAQVAPTATIAAEAVESDVVVDPAQSLLSFLAEQGATNLTLDNITLDGDYARVMTSEAVMFYKKAGDGWEFLAGGAMFAPEDLEQLGVPLSLLP